jgi:hypothetical protein
MFQEAGTSDILILTFTTRTFARGASIARSTLIRYFSGLDFTAGLGLAGIGAARLADGMAAGASIPIMGPIMLDQITVPALERRITVLRHRMGMETGPQAMTLTTIQERLTTMAGQ